MSTPTDPVVRSEGQRLLLEQPGSLRELAKAAGCARQSIANWRAGLKTPEPVNRPRLRVAFGIPEAAWTVEPGTPLDASNAEASESSNGATHSTPLDGPLPTTLEAALELLTLLRVERSKPGLASAERIRLAQTEGQILNLRHRLEKEAELLEDRIVREHPAWQRLKRGILKVLVQFPAAGRAVLAELQQLEA